MKIGFEAKRLFKNFTGLGNYSRFVVDALSKYFPNNDYLLYTPKLSNHSEVQDIIHRDNVRVISPSASYNNLKLTSLWRSWGMTRHASMNELNIFHGLSHELPFGLPKHIKRVVTVHDLIFFRYPQFYNPIDIAIYKAKVKSACHIADKVIAISRQTADDLIQFLKIDASKIQVVYQGCHPSFKQNVSSEEIVRVKKKYNLPNEYVLNVGTIEERKNVEVLIRALASITPSERCPLVIMGRPTEYKKRIIALAEQLGVSSLIMFLQDIPFIEFPSIYQGAKIFVYPSMFEGFGIPLIEAIESGIPVITSKGSCFTEAAGPDSLYIDSNDPESLAFHIKRLQSDKMLRSRMTQKSREYVRQFDPEVIAKNLSSIYTSL